MPPVVVTRPAREAQRWVAQLAVRGLAAQALPLIEISAVADPVPLQAAWQQLGRYAALMFVSGNAVEHFFAAGAAPASTLPRCLCTGPGTRAALLQAGVPAADIDAPAKDAEQFDSEALWSVVGQRAWQGLQVLIVRGGRAPASPGAAADAAGDGRDWLSRQFEAAGASVDFVQAYERRAPRWTPQQRAQVRELNSAGAIWLLSSSEAVGHLPSLDWSAARAVATHARIAQAARSLGFGVVCESRPALDDVVRSIESLA